MSYDAFISYSHAADGRLAPAIQAGLQRLAKQWWRPRALRVFRDETALSANPHMWGSIRSALNDSDWFVFMASPEAVASRWVNQELAYWVASKPTARILVAVTSGTWEWDASRRALSGTAVPKVLVDVFDDQPRYVDLRWAQAFNADFDIAGSRFRDAVAQLAAPIHGIPKDELEGDDIRQHRRARGMARGAATLLSLLTVISLIATAFAFNQRSDANRNADHARALQRTAELRSMATAGLAKVQSSVDIQDGLLLAAAASRQTDDPQVRDALLRALEEKPRRLLRFVGSADHPSDLEISHDGSLVAIAGPTLTIHRISDGVAVRLPSIDHPRGVVFSGDDRRVAVQTDDAIRVVDLVVHRVVLSISIKPYNFGSLPGVDLHGHELVLTRGATVVFVDVAINRIRTWKIPAVAGRYAVVAAVSPDRRRLAVISTDQAASTESWGYAHITQYELPTFRLLSTEVINPRSPGGAPSSENYQECSCIGSTLRYASGPSYRLIAFSDVLGAVEWDAMGHSLLTIDGSDPRVNRRVADASTDLRQILTLTYSGTADIWNLDLLKVGSTSKPEFIAALQSPLQQTAFDAQELGNALPRFLGGDRLIMLEKTDIALLSTAPENASAQSELANVSNFVPLPKKQGDVLAISRDGSVAFVAGEGDGLGHLIDAHSGRSRGGLELRTPEAPQGAAFSPDGSHLAVVFDSAVQLWDVATGSRVASLVEPAMQPTAQFSPRGDVFEVARGQWGPVMFLDASTGQVLSSIGDFTHRATFVAFLPDGVSAIIRKGDLLPDDLPRDSVARTDPPNFAVDVRTGEPAGAGDARRWIGLTAGLESTDISFSRDERLMAWNNRDGRYFVRDTSTGRLVQTVTSRDAFGNSAFAWMLITPDGSTLVIGGDATRMWDVRTGLQIGDALQIGVLGMRRGAAFANGDVIVVDAEPGATPRQRLDRVPLTSDRLRSVACGYVDRDVTEADWMRYGSDLAHVPAC